MDGADGFDGAIGKEISGREQRISAPVLAFTAVDQQELGWSLRLNSSLQLMATR